MEQARYFAARFLAPLASVAVASCCFAQQPPNRPAATSPQHSATLKQPLAKSAPTPSAPVSLLQQPPQPAKINLTSGKLSVEANNSSLSQILQQISQSSGMKIDGLRSGGNSDQRIFGNYGPAAPREVLSELLNGSGYNVLMLGATASGAPRELTLTARSGGSAAVANTPQAPQENSQDNSDQDDAPPAQNQDPDANQQPAPEENPGAVRTPQQMLQELQRQREQQQPQ